MVVVLVVLEGVVILVLAVLVVGLLRSHAEILRRLHELGAGVYDDEDDSVGTRTAPAGDGVTSPVELRDNPVIRTREGVPEPRADATPAYDVVGTTPDGRTKSVGIIDTPHTTLLAFLSSGCGTCADFWRAFAAGEADALPGFDTRLVVVTKGADEESVSAVASLADRRFTTVMSTQAFADYGVPVAPYFILVDGSSSRVVGEGAAASWSQVAHLLEQAAADAGFGPSPSSSRRARGDRGVRDDRAPRDEREARVDADLLAAGITPGHQSLYPDRLDDDE
jgi:hypothetical protein